MTSRVCISGTPPLHLLLIMLETTPVQSPALPVVKNLSTSDYSQAALVIFPPPWAVFVVPLHWYLLCPSAGNMARPHVPQLLNSLLQTTCSSPVCLETREPITAREWPRCPSACARCCTSHFTLRFFSFSTSPLTGYVRHSFPTQLT
jgi:hypothetical protein